MQILPAGSAAYSSGSWSPTAQRSARLVLPVVPRWQATHTTLHCTTLHCTTLHYTALHYTRTHSRARAHRTPWLLLPSSSSPAARSPPDTRRRGSAPVSQAPSPPSSGLRRPPRPRPYAQRLHCFQRRPGRTLGREEEGVPGLGLQASNSASYRPGSASPAAACAKGWTKPSVGFGLECPPCPFVALSLGTSRSHSCL